MKHALILASLSLNLSRIQAESTSFGQQLPVDSSSSVATQRLPPYVVYRHFLNWVNKLDKDATDSGAVDSYKFAEPFSRANLKYEDLDRLRDAAHHLDSDLNKHEARAQLVISKYRKEAKKLIDQGKPLPPPPPEIRDLERQRTAILIQQYVSLRTNLGPDTAAQLDRYLDYEFTPHIKLKQMATPAVPVQSPPGN